ncbi:MAG: hypothetical protein U0900_24360, partial [Myxococcota bacterium]
MLDEGGSRGEGVGAGIVCPGGEGGFVRQRRVRLAARRSLALAFVATCAFMAMPPSVRAEAAAPVAPADPAARAAAADRVARFEKLESVKAFDALMANFAEMRTMILSDATSEREASEGMRF